MSWKDAACMSIGRYECPNVDEFIVQFEKTKSSPIDTFYTSTSEIMSKVTPDFFEVYGANFAGLMFVGLISATENYFRDILGVILSVCPISQIHSADEKIQLGSLLWGPRELHNRSAFEFMAFSNSKNIKDTFNNFTNHVIKQGSSWNSMLQEYDKLCEFRHSVVHSGSIIAGKNAVKLRLKPSRKVMKFELNYGLMQSAGRVCTALVQAANNELFQALVRRWVNEWRAFSSWNPEDSEALIKSVYLAFLSKRDRENKTIPSPQNFPTFLASVKEEFDL